MLAATVVAVAETGIAAPLRLLSETVDTITPKQVIDAPLYGVGVVQANGRAADLRSELEKSGITILGYVPEDAWIVRLTEATARSVPSLKNARWASEWKREWRIHPLVATNKSAQPERLELRLWNGSDSKPVFQLLDELGATGVIQRESDDNESRILFNIVPSSAVELAALEAVAWIEPAPVASPRLNTSTWVIQSNQMEVGSLWNRDLTGAGQILGHLDTSIDPNVCYFLDSTVKNNSPGLNHRKMLKIYNTDGFPGSHGTRTAGAAVGLREDLSLDHAGIAYDSRFVHGSTTKISGLDDKPSTLKSAFNRAQRDGAFIHTNSWGDNNPDLRSYTHWCRDIDDYTWSSEDAVVVFAVANNDFQTDSVLTPENAKNCVAVSASLDSTRQHQWGIGTDGPTIDNRLKPEIMAPGVNISMPAADSANCETEPATGTSYAAPQIAGLALLVRQYFMDGYHPTGSANSADEYTPSGALVRAMLLNGTTDMTGVGPQNDKLPYNHDFPNIREGWGRALSDNALFFAGENRGLQFVDRRHADGLSDGKSVTHMFSVSSSDEPLHITLVWTDPPAEHAAAVAIVNDLNLEVKTPDNAMYLGNVFSGSQSAVGGNADHINTVEQVRLSNPPPGLWSLTVRGHKVPLGPQGFAVVITGAVAKGNTEDIWFVY